MLWDALKFNAMWWQLLFTVCTLVAAQNPKIRIGRTVSEIGVYQFVGESTCKGIEFWANWTNTHGGIVIKGVAHDVELVTYNDASDLKIVEIAYEHLIEKDNVVALFGPWSTAMTGPALEVAARYEFPVVFSGASSPLYYSKGYTNSFGTLIRFPSRYAPCWDVVVQRGNPRTAVIVASDDPFQQASLGVIRGQLATLGINTIYNVTISKVETAFEELAKRVITADPDLLILATEIVTTAPFLEELRKEDWEAEAIIITNTAVAELAYEQIGWKADLTFAGDQWAPSMPYQDPIFGSSQGFADTYKEAVGYVPGYVDAGAVIAGFIMTDALQRAASLNTSDIIAAIRETNMPETFFGPIRFLETGEVELEGICKQLQPVANSEDEDTRQSFIVYPSKLANSQPIYPAIPDRPPPPPLTETEKRNVIIICSVAGFVLIVGFLAIFGFYLHRKYYFIRLQRSSTPEDIAI